jgi:hypothetical protein
VVPRHELGQLLPEFGVHPCDASLIHAARLTAEVELLRMLPFGRRLQK